MFAGVTYNFFIVNGILAAELFLIFKSFWAIGGALIAHLAGAALCLRATLSEAALWISVTRA